VLRFLDLVEKTGALGTYGHRGREYVLAEHLLPPCSENDLGEERVVSRPHARLQ
jgi:hypothetical protein